MLSLACPDAGVKDCDYLAKGETEEELWKDGTEHVIKVHGMKAADVTLQFKDRLMMRGGMTTKNMMK